MTETNLEGMVNDPTRKPITIGGRTRVWGYKTKGEMGREMKELGNKNSELKEINSELSEIAERDELTRVMSRRAIQKYGEGLVKSHKEFSVLYVDADFFKSVNDDISHIAGDVVLKIIAQRIQHNIPEGDKIGRIGGEEFLVILKDVSDLETAGKRADEIRQLFSENPIFVDVKEGRQSINQTVSIGVASYKGLNGFEDVVENADKALHKAKEDGRNRVVLESQLKR